MPFVAGQILTAAQMNDLEGKTVPPGVINPFAGINSPSGWLLCDGSDVSRTTYSSLFATFGTTFTTATTNSTTTVSGLSGMSTTLHVGWGIAGTNIPTGATIVSVTNATTVVISAAATGSTSGTANIAISPYGFTGAGNTTTFLLPNLKGRLPVGLDTAQSEFNILGEIGGSKTHTLTSAEMPSHTHIQDAHTHTQTAHNHTQNSHTHTGTTDTAKVNTTLRVVDVAGTSLAANHATGYGAGGFTDLADNATNLPGGNHDHDFTTGSATPSINNTTAVNNNATATNQNTGGGGAHNNLQPYLTLNFIIKT